VNLENREESTVPAPKDVGRKYEMHIQRICKVEDIAIESHSRGGRAYRRQRRIKIRPIKSAITYAVALHEIGHILGPRQNGTRLDKEVGAWEWAEANAIEWTDAMSAKRAACLRSYLKKVERSPRMRKPTAHHPIYAMVSS
jgi:CRISPR/Cas system-associated endonuclease Cas3-HD